MTKLTRRGVLAGAAGAAVAAQTPFLIGKARAADPSKAGPLKIGMIIPKTGPQTQQGEYLAKGAQLYLQQAGNKLLGQPCELVWLDEVDPQTAQVNAQRLVDEEKVIALLGGGISPSALAIGSVAKRAKIPYVANNAGAREVTGAKCNRYMFRTIPTLPVASAGLAPYLLTKGKRWYIFAASYSFGDDLLRSMTDLLQAAGGTAVGVDRTPLGTKDFTSYLLKMREAKPDVVIAGVPADDLTNFLKQYADMGFRDKIPVTTPNIGTTDIWGVGAQASTGIYTTPWYYKDPNLPPEEKQFVTDFTKAYGKPPADKGWFGWYGMKVLMTAIENAKTTEPAKIVAALETLKLPDGSMEATMRPWDHQLLHRFLVVKVKDKITDQWDYFDILQQVPESTAKLDALFGSKQEIGCTLDDI